MEGQKDSSKWPIGLRFHDQKLYANGRLMVLSTLETEYLVEMHSVHYCAAAKIAPDVLRRTTIFNVNAKLARFESTANCARRQLTLITCHKAS